MYNHYKQQRMMVVSKGLPMECLDTVSVDALSWVQDAKATSISGSYTRPSPGTGELRKTLTCEIQFP